MLRVGRRLVLMETAIGYVNRLAGLSLVCGEGEALTNIRFD